MMNPDPCFGENDFYNHKNTCLCQLNLKNEPIVLQMM